VANVVELDGNDVVAAIELMDEAVAEGVDTAVRDEAVEEEAVEEETVEEEAVEEESVEEEAVEEEAVEEEAVEEDEVDDEEYTTVVDDGDTRDATDEDDVLVTEDDTVGETALLLVETTIETGPCPLEKLWLPHFSTQALVS
jgi:hypothetical protein